MKKLDTKSKILITILIIIIFVLLGLCIYLVLSKEEPKVQGTKKDNNIQKTSLKLNESKGDFYIEKGNTYKIYSNFENEIKEVADKKIVFNYPVININTSSVIEINNKIKSFYNKTEKELKNYLEEGCTCVKIDDAYHCGEHIKGAKYKVFDSNKAISIIISEQYYTECAGSYNNDTIYTVSKETNNELKQEEILSLFNYERETVVKGLLDYINSNTQQDLSDALKESPNKIFFAIKDGKLLIGHNLLEGFDYYSYDGNTFTELTYKDLNN